jgi:anti-anti-sigma regulatory factor
MQTDCDGTVHARAEGDCVEAAMLNLAMEKIGELALVVCQGRIVRSEAAFQLRALIMSLRDAPIIVLDLSEVSAVEGGGLGMLVFLQRWAYDEGIQLKLFNPIRAVQDRLERAGPIPAFAFSSRYELMALLANADRSFKLAA